MKIMKRQPKGVTLMELMIYLGISTIVVLALTSYLVQATKARVEMNNQQFVQHNTRQALEKMTYALRNAYDVAVYQEGSAVDIYSYNFDDPAKPIIYTFKYKDQDLFYGQSVEVPPAEESLQQLTDDGVSVESVSFKKISSSLQVQLVMKKNERQATLNSTIAFRQQ